MINILYIADSLKQRFGITSVVLNYIENFPKDKIKVDLLVFADSEEAIVSKFEALGTKVYYMPKLNLLNIRRFRRFIKSFFEQGEYGIVHSHFNQIDGIVFPIARKHGVKTCISHSHNTRLSDNFIKAIRNRVMCSHVYYNADICAACSIVAGEFLYGKRFRNSEKALVINNAIDSELFQYNLEGRRRIREEFSIANQTIILGNIGSIKPQKNQFYLLKILKKLKEMDDRDYKLMIVGDGPLLTKLKKEAIKTGVFDKIIFTGVRKDIPAFLSAFDIFLLPSLYEGLPVVGVEAQTSDLPCIFSNKITKEVNFNNVMNICIKEECVEVWANAIIDTKISHRCNTQDLILKNGYEIKREALHLYEIYSEFYS